MSHDPSYYEQTMKIKESIKNENRVIYYNYMKIKEFRKIL